MMPDNWGYVAAAYGVTAAVLGLYWRHLVQKEKELRTALKSSGFVNADRKREHSARTVADTARANSERPLQS